MNRHLLLLLPPILWLTLAFQSGSSYPGQAVHGIASIQPDLPVSLPIYLEEESGIISVSWYKPDMEGITHFLVERTSSGSDFIQVGGLNIAASEDRYVFKDILPVRSTGPLTYRIKMHFRDGSFAYSDLKRIVPSVNNQLEITETGNGQYTFSLPTKVENAQMEIRTISGSIAVRSAFSGQEGKISLAGQPSGSYLLVINSRTQSWERSLSHP